MEQSGNIKPNKYNHGKIYKLVDSLGFYYVGSTCSSLSKRLSEHKATSKRDSNRKVYKQITNWNDVSIVLIAEVNVENKEQLMREEDKYIDRTDPFCLNSFKAFSTVDEKQQYHQQYYDENKKKIKKYKQQYYTENKKEILQKNQKYHSENKDKIHVRKRQLIKCICGLEITKSNFKQHTRSKKHLRFVKDNEQENVSL